LTPDALSPLGEYLGNDDKGQTIQIKRDRNKMLEYFITEEVLLAFVLVDEFLV
jgi:predicted nucleic-acid-binding protein